MKYIILQYKRCLSCAIDIRQIQFHNVLHAIFLVQGKNTVALTIQNFRHFNLHWSGLCNLEVCRSKFVASQVKWGQVPNGPIYKGHTIFSPYTALDININLNNVYSPVTPGSFPFVKLQKNSYSLRSVSWARHIFSSLYTKSTILCTPRVFLNQNNTKIRKHSNIS